MQTVYKKFRKIIAGEVYRRRIKLRLTQTELAQKAGLSRAVVSRIERQEMNPSLETLLRLYDALSDEKK
jgi:transcriptional regulator with XRE-family HTH domain